MPTTTQSSNSSALIALQAEIQRDLERFRDLMPQTQSSRVKVLQSKQFEFPGGKVDGQPFDAVVLDWRWVNNYYASAYNPTDKAPPLCWAVGPEPGKLIPSPHGSQVQADACSKCRMNEFGSKGRGKACRNTLRIALVPPGANAETTPWILTVSPTGVKWFVTYANLLAKSERLPIHMLTKIGFDSRESYPTVRFQAAGENPDLATAYSLKLAAQDALNREYE